MNKSILPLIEEAIQNNNEQTIKDVDSKLEMDIKQTKLFIRYFKKFIILSSILDSIYVNYFNKTCLIDLKEKDELTDENFAKAIVLFIKEKRANRNLYYVSLQSENDTKLHKLILSQLDYKSFKYKIQNNIKINLDLNIFKYVNNLNSEYDLEKISELIIKKEKDCQLINYINLDNISYEKVLNYSKKYPNRIKNIFFYEFEDYDKIKKLLELNKESLVSYPHGKIEYLIPLPNAYIFNLRDFKGNLDTNIYNLNKIIDIKSINCGINEEENIINFLNKCPNAESLFFDDINSDSFFKIIENINCPKIKNLLGTIEYQEGKIYNWNILLEKMPLLEDLSITEKSSFDWAYSVYPIFEKEKKKLVFPILEQLIKNYLNSDPERDITISFDTEIDEFNEFWDYFKDKKDILSKVSEINCEYTCDFIDSYFKIGIYKDRDIDSIKNIKYCFCFVEEIFDDKILEFVKKNKIEYLFIKNGGNIELDKLKECNDLKFVFDNLTKKFMFKNKDNNILEII